MITHSKYIAVLTLVASVCLSAHARAVISITDFTVSPTGVSFHISGVFPETNHPTESNAIFFEYYAGSATPNFISSLNTASSSSASLLGSQALNVSAPVGTGDISGLRYIYVSFQNNIASGESMSGNITAEWSDPTFTLSEIRPLNVYWGYVGMGTSIYTSNVLTTVTPVPEPSGIVLLLGSGLFASFRRRRGA